MKQSTKMIINGFCIMILLFLIGCNNQNSTVDNENIINNDISFDFEARTVKLNSGYEMPILGLGTYSLKDEVAINSVSYALSNGYELIDTASIYGNEESIGEGIKKAGVSRDKVFITTKLYMDQYNDASNAIDEALEKLDLEYIDLMLLHHPGENDIEAYKAMEKAVADKKLRSIGLSNYYIEELKDFLPEINITPAVIQNEIHPYYQENDVIADFKNQGIVMEAWYPLGGRGHTKDLFEDETIADLAGKYNKSSAQIILRWHLQKGVVAIPGSSNPDHISENMDIFDFELSSTDMEKINSLDRNEKHDWY